MAAVGDTASYLSRASDLPAVKAPITVLTWQYLTAATGNRFFAGLTNQSGAAGARFGSSMNAGTVVGRRTNDAGTLASATVATTNLTDRWQAQVVTLRSNADIELRYGRANAQYVAAKDTTSQSPSDFNTICVGAEVVVTPANFMTTAQGVAFFTIWPFELPDVARILLLQGLHPVFNDVIPPPAQCYPLIADGRCMITGLNLTNSGGMTFDGRAPTLRVLPTMRNRVAAVMVGSASGTIFVPLVGDGGLVGPARGLAA